MITDPAGFQALREAYETALDWVRNRPDEVKKQPQHIEQRPGNAPTGWEVPYTVQFTFSHTEQCTTGVPAPAGGAA